VSNLRYAAYASSKAAVTQLTRVLAVEWAPHGVTVNAIGPAAIPTALSQPIFADERQREAALARIPMGRFGTAEDVIGVAVFLLSPAAAFVTGQVLFVDGGRTISNHRRLVFGKWSGVPRKDRHTTQLSSNQS
jgi:NAD(P)-dependent dehydrogenase (short-subunit alcohol dehydrogenase family)